MSLHESGQIVEVRRRRWVVTDLQASAVRETLQAPQHLVSLTSLDEDALGEELQVIWQLEAGAQIIERAGLPSDFNRRQVQ